MKLKPEKPPMLSKADLLSVTGSTEVIDTKENLTRTLKLADIKMTVTKNMESSGPLCDTNTNNHINIMCHSKNRTSESQAKNVDINDIDLSRLTISSEMMRGNKVSTLDDVHDVVQGMETLNLNRGGEEGSEQGNKDETVKIEEELNIKLEAEDVEAGIEPGAKLTSVKEVEEVIKDEDRSLESEEDEEGREQPVPQKPKKVTSLKKDDTLHERSPMKGNDGARERRVSQTGPYKSFSRSHQCGGTIVVSEPDLSDSAESLESPYQLLPPNIDPNYTNLSPESNIGPDSPQYAYCHESISPLQGDYAGPYVCQGDGYPRQAELAGNFDPSASLDSPAFESVPDDILTDMIQQATNDPVFMKNMEEGLNGDLNIFCDMGKANVSEPTDFIPETVRQLSNSSTSPVPQSPTGWCSPGTSPDSSQSPRPQVVPHMYRDHHSSNSFSSSSPGTISIHSPFSSPSLSPEISNHQNPVIDFTIILGPPSDDLSPRVQEIKNDLESCLDRIITHADVNNGTSDAFNTPQGHLATSSITVPHTLGSNSGTNVAYPSISPAYNTSVQNQSNGLDFNNGGARLVPDVERQTTILELDVHHHSTLWKQQSISPPTQKPTFDANCLENSNGPQLLPPGPQQQQHNIYEINSLPAIVLSAPINGPAPMTSAHFGSIRAAPSNLTLITHPIQQLPRNGDVENLVYMVQVPTASASSGQFRSIIPSPVLPQTSTETGRERLLALCNKQKKEAAWVRISSLSDEELTSKQDGDTQLMILVSNGAGKKHPEMLYAIVERLKKIPGGLTAVNNHQLSALYHACYHNDPLAARYLAETITQLNVNLDQESKGGNGLLHMLCRKGDSHVQVLAELLTIKDANGEPLFNINRHNHSEGTPLHVAVDTHGVGGVSCINMVHLLLNMGANILEQERRGGNTPLHCAVTQACCPLLVHTLLRPERLPGRSTGVVNNTNYSRNTPLHLVCPRADVPRDRQLKVVKLLVDHGAVSSRLNHNGKAPLALVMPDRKEAIRSLLHRR